MQRLLVLVLAVTILAGCGTNGAMIRANEFGASQVVSKSGASDLAIKEALKQNYVRTTNSAMFVVGKVDLIKFFPKPGEKDTYMYTLKVQLKYQDIWGNWQQDEKEIGGKYNFEKDRLEIWSITTG